MPSPSTIESDQEPAGSDLSESPALAPAQAVPKEKKKKPAPSGVEVLPRTVAVDGKIVPMPDSEQVKLPWQ